MSKDIALKVDGIDVFYNEFKALWNISLEVGNGEIV